MRNKVEILRAIEYTIIDLESIQNLDEIAEFTDADKEFMEAFKKIYEFGLKQLEFFINKLDEDGKDLDEYSIQYYVNLLLNGPLGNYARELAKDKLYFINTPDALGTLGNLLRSSQNTTVLEGTVNPLGCSVDVYNKLPLFMQLGLTQSVDEVENVFKSSLKSSTTIDNTLPVVDKQPQLRYDLEPSGAWTSRANGSYLVKDSFFYNIIDSIQSDIFDLIQEYLTEENYRIYTDKKGYNPFGNNNDSTSKHYTLKKVLTEGDKTQEVDIDITGNIIDSIARRGSTIKVETDVENKEFILSTNEGQLGN